MASTIGHLHGPPTLRIRLRGKWVEISFGLAPDGNVPWWASEPIDPPLAYDELRAINAFVKQELSRRLEWWRTGHETRRSGMPAA